MKRARSRQEIWASVTKFHLYVSEGRLSPGEGHKVRTGWVGRGQPGTFMKEMSGDKFVPEGRLG